MRIIPVVDLMSGNVVRGVAGRRHEYRPIRSRLAADARPRTVAQALVGQFGFREVYVADLDAIGSHPPGWNLYRQISDAGLRLLIDAGITDLNRAIELSQFEPAPEGIIIGLESLSGPELLSEVVQIIEPRRLLFSLDLKLGKPITNSAAWVGQTTAQIAATAIELGVERFIVLDLARVGMGDGVGTEPICRHLKATCGKLQIIAGGGVRSIDDIRSLAAAGCDAALVASALHDGRITPDQVRALDRCTAM